jgi:hypothetical protein
MAIFPSARSLALFGAVLLAPASATTLAELEARIGLSSELRQADAQLLATQARRELAAADTGIRLFGSMSLARGRDAARPERYRIETAQPNGLITTTEQILTPVAEGRNRVTGQLGIRLPLFGSRAVLDENLAQASAAIDVQRHRRKAVEMETLKALRYAYSQAYYGTIAGRLARDYLALEPAARQYLRARGAGRMVLADEQGRWLATFAEAAQHQGEAGAATDAALATIAAITGLAVNGEQLSDPAFAVHCLSEGVLQAAIESHPEIASLSALAEQRRREVAAAGAAAVEGSLSLSHSAIRENLGRSGYSGAIAVDISMPLGLDRWRAAQRGVALAELQRAQLALDARREAYVAGVRGALRTGEIAQQRLEAARQLLAAEDEAVRIAALRRARSQEGGEDSLLHKRYARYGAARAMLQASLALTLRQADLLGFSKACAGSPPDGVATGPGAALRNAGLNPVEPGAAATVDGRADRSHRLGWYAWHLFERLSAAGAARVLATLPPASRILMSMTRAELDSVKPDGAERQLLRAFLDAAHTAGIEVELLLGEPRWALPEHHADLLAIVADLQGLPFAGVHLDIERAQLPAAQRAQWAQGITALMRRIKEISRRPLSLSIHHRDATPALLSAFRANGADEVTVMYFNTRASTVGAVLVRLMKEHPQLRFSLAQSVEPQLPPGESHARSDPTQTIETLTALSHTLAAQPNFSGVVVQSLDHFLERVQ